MFCEKNSDEIDHYKNFGHQKVFSIFIQKIILFSTISVNNDVLMIYLSDMILFLPGHNL